MRLVSGCLDWRERDGDIVDKSCYCSQEQSDGPDTFSRLTLNSCLVSEQIRHFQAVLKPHVRAGGEACQGTQAGTLSPRRASHLPTKPCFTFRAVKTLCRCLINDISRIAHDGRGLIPIKLVPAPRPKSSLLRTQ